MKKIFTLLTAALISASMWATEGALSGRFTINANGDQVVFSQGNLQYQASTQTWRFAENQYDYIGADNANISDTCTGWIDLFGWGTGDAPTKHSTNFGEYTTFTDWGVNPISNGGNEANQWRTLTIEETSYLFYDSGKMKGQATVNGVHGIVIFPDNWTLPAGLSFTSFPKNWTTNVYSVSEWQQMQDAGAVFLPCAGTRYGSEVASLDEKVKCWSSSSEEEYGYEIEFDVNSSGILMEDFYIGFSVRLVQTAPEPTQPEWVQPGDEWDEDTKTLTVNSNPGELAYYDNQEIEHLIISDGVTNIGYSAFHFCEHISSVVIPNSVTGIENYAFYYCEDLLSVVIPGSVNRIGESAFENCVGLTSVTIEEGVTVIGFAAFGYCVALTSVYIPNTIIRIENDAFHQCYALTHIDIPNSVTNIGNYAFSSCTSLTDLVIPSNVESIGSKAFFNCSALISVTIGAGVTSIGESAFQRCSALTSVTCEAVNPPTSEYGIFGECLELAHIYVPAESVEAYKTATNWSVYEAIIEAIRPSWLRDGDEWDEATKTLTVNSNPEEGAYQYNTEIEHVIISEGVTSVGSSAFYYCTNLTTIELPGSMENIGDYAFQGCPAIVSVTCEALTPPTMGDGVFFDSSALEHIYVPAWAVDAYQAADEWSAYASAIEPIPGTEAIEDIRVDGKTVKTIVNGQLILERNGKTYNALGTEIK